MGEKIGKTHLTYAQGASAEIIAMLTIGLADRFGFAGQSPTHVLSSGVAGSMSGQQIGSPDVYAAQRSAGLGAYVAGLPCVFLGAMFFAGGLLLVYLLLRTALIQIKKVSRLR